MKPAKIIIAGLMMDTNLGEAIYPYVLAKKLSGGGYTLQFENLDFYGRSNRCEKNTTFIEDIDLLYSSNCGKKKIFFLKVLNRLSGLIGRPEYFRHIAWKLNQNNEKRLTRYYTSILKGASLLVFPGGGIIECTSNHDYYHHIDLITKIADELQIPCCFNAVGRVVDYRHMFGWNTMRKALNRKCVKSITCRDGADWINQNLYYGKKIAAEIPCCAIFSSQAYQIQKNPTSNTIGIGVIRGNIFESYGISISQEKLLSLYEQIIRKLLKMGYSCCVFTNGYSKDIQFGQLLSKRLGLLENVEFCLYVDSGEKLVQTIASFKALITARLHSIIVAYSLDIPSIGISWTEKVTDFLKLVGSPQNAIQTDKLEDDIIITALEQAVKKGYPLTTRKILEDKVCDKMTKILSYIQKE